MGALCGALLLAGCTSGGDDRGGEDPTYEKIVLAHAEWAGTRANAAVAAALLERHLDVKVEVREMPTEKIWDALDKGEVHAHLEDWRGNLEQEKQYIDERHTVVEGGDLGVTGHIGWFVPKYFADENPDVADWKNLNKYAADFAAPGSGGKGELLGAEKSWTSYDKHLVRNLDLDYRITPSKSEDALVAELDRRYAAKEPFLTYWYEPHWKNLDLDLVEVELPDYVEGCNEPAEVTDCAYFNTPLQKFFHADFAEHGGAAAELLHNFRWTTDQQNEVAKQIAEGNRTPAEVAAEWIGKNRETWQRWLPRTDADS